MGGRGSYSASSLMAMAGQGKKDGPSEKLLNAPWQKYSDGNRVSVGATLAQGEARIVGNDYETGLLVDSNGFVVAAYKGGKSSVNFADEPAYLFNGAIMTHNHPSGLPAFSKADIATSGLYALDGGKLKSVRATSVNGTFSITATRSNADWGKLATNYSNNYPKLKSKAQKAMTDAIVNAQNQGLSHKDVISAGNKAAANVFASYFMRAAKPQGFTFVYER